MAAPGAVSGAARIDREDGGEGFEIALEVLLDGVEARLARSRS